MLEVIHWAQMSISSSSHLPTLRVRFFAIALSTCAVTACGESRDRPASAPTIPITAPVLSPSVTPTLTLAVPWTPTATQTRTLTLLLTTTPIRTPTPTEPPTPTHTQSLTEECGIDCFGPCYFPIAGDPPCPCPFELCFEFPSIETESGILECATSICFTNELLYPSCIRRIADTTDWCYELPR